MRSRAALAFRAWVLVAPCLSLCACFEARLKSSSEHAGDAGAADASKLPLLHPQCTQPLADEDLERAFEAHAYVLEQAQPNAFLALDCADVAPVPRCTSDNVCPFSGYCMIAVPGEPGYCLNDLAEGTAPLGYRDGLCRRRLVGTAEKAALCCSGVPGVDCREHPFTTAGSAGMFCASTSECEPGLVCRAAAVEGRADAVFGTCQCPEASAAWQSEPASCGGRTGQRWGKPAPLGTEGSCQPAADPAFVQEVVAVGWPTATLFVQVQSLRTPTAHTAFVSTFLNSDQLVAQVSDVAALTPLTRVSDFAFGYALYELGLFTHRYTTAFDAQRQLHVMAYNEEEEGEGLYVTSGAAAWTREPLPERCRAAVALAFDPQGFRHVLCEDQETLLHFAEAEGGFAATPHAFPYASSVELLFPSDGRIVAAADGEWDAVLDLSSGSKLWDNQAAAVFEPLVDAASAGNAVAWVVVSDYKHVVLLTWTPSDGVKRETVWSVPAPFDTSYEDPAPSIALRDDGEIAIAHRSPEGIALLRRRGERWESSVLTSDDGRPQAVLGAGGELEIYYTLDGGGRGVHELRRVREGSCAP